MAQRCVSVADSVGAAEDRATAASAMKSAGRITGLQMTLEVSMKKWPLHAIGFSLVLALSIPAWAQTQSQQNNSDVNAMWDQLLRDVIPATPPDPALVVAQRPIVRRCADDFLNHFFFQSQTEYMRQEISFTGRPTPSGVIDADLGEFFDARGIPFRGAFQPNSDHVFHFMNLGTRGWLSPRVNTNFSFRYRQDLTHVEAGSPVLTGLNTFGSNRRTELLSGSVEFRGLPTDGAFAGTSLQIGRQHTFGAEVAAYDGASFTVNRRKYALSLYGGRRFTYYSDPDQRAIGGGSLTVRLSDRASIEYDALFYVKGSHTIAFRNRFNPSWLFNTYAKMVGDSPIDYSVQAMYLPRDGKTTVRGSFFQKLSDKDFFYDYTVLARDLDTHNRLQRLVLGPVSPYSQVVFDVRRDISPYVRAGGAVWVRQLNDSNDQGPYDTSFQDYRINTQIFTPGRIDTFLELHHRNVDRRSPVGAVEFDDVSIAGETRVQDVRIELRRNFGEGTLSLRGGAFYRRFDFQNRFFFIDKASVKGLLGGAQVKLDDHTRLYFDYSLDDDFFVFRPSIQRAQTLMLGMAWRY
ncbi:MAG: hypothetical protein HY646_13475 [Acidobacteria bacterium]|nr:hypothetical protein [Acidobacteriota bacterium]